jgi:hypothetical protein
LSHTAGEVWENEGIMAIMYVTLLHWSIGKDGIGAGITIKVGFLRKNYF